MAATGRVGVGSEFEARVSLFLEGPYPRDLPPPLVDDLERSLDSPDVRNLVRSRLGETPPVWATAAPDGTVFVRSRGATPERAAKATETYATSYVDVKRRQIEAQASAASEKVLRMTDEIRSQLEAAEEPQRTSLVGLLGLFNTQLDRLQLDMYGPHVVGSTSAERVHDWSQSALLVAGLGAAVGVGAAISGRRSAGGRHGVNGEH
jgi:hypothetical protein